VTHQDLPTPSIPRDMRHRKGPECSHEGFSDAPPPVELLAVPVAALSIFRVDRKARPFVRLAKPGNAASGVMVALAAFASLVARPAGLAAQTPADPHAAQPERPTVATHAGTVATGWLEIEAGAELDRYADRSHAAVFPVVTKLGLARRLQLETQTPIVRPGGEDTPGIGDFSIGVKWRPVEAAPIVGDFAILPSIKVPSGSADSGTGTGTTDINLVFISSHKLGPIAMDLNFGYTRRGGDGTVAPRKASVWTAAFGGPTRGRLGWVAELYEYPATSGPAGVASTVAFLGGPTVEVREWLVLDAGLIIPIAGPQPRALYAGAVYNVGRLWK
jgi:hypothetical protein